MRVQSTSSVSQFNGIGKRSRSDLIFPKQKRSRARRAAILETGKRLLEQRDFEDISVVDLTSAQGFSTGSFYSAFRDKAAFFIALQNDVGAEFNPIIHNQLEGDALKGMDAYQRVSRVIDLVTDFFRRYRGAIGSALRNEAALPEGWAPHRANAQRISDALGEGLSMTEAEKAQLATQMVFGTLVNAVLHDPGPLHLDDKNICDTLKRVVKPFLKVAT